MNNADHTPNPSAPNTPRHFPREPMPTSFRPFWVFVCAIFLVAILIGLASYVIALLVQ